MQLTKIDAAESHIAAAVRLYFQGQPIAPVFTLAAASREILTTIGGKMGVRTMLHGLAEDTGHPLREFVREAHEFANFFKHADRDATATIELDEEQVAIILFMACGDFARIAGGMSVEAQVYEAWCFATSTPKIGALPLRAQKTIKNIIKYFPAGMRSAPLDVQKRMGWAMLFRHENDERLRMDIKRIVEIAKGDSCEARSD